MRCDLQRSPSAQLGRDHHRARKDAQFNLLGLSALYSSEAAREISNIRHNLQLHFDAGGADTSSRRTPTSMAFSPRKSPQFMANSRTYQALSHDTWFYSGGFA